MKERTFKPKIKMMDGRKSNIQPKSAERAYDSPLAKAVRKQKDYKKPSSYKRKK